MTAGITTWFPVAVMLVAAGVVVLTMISINRLIGARGALTEVKG